MPNSIALIILILLIVAAVFVALQSGIGTKKKTERSRIYSDLESLRQKASTSSSANNRDLIIRLDALLAKTLQFKYSNSLSCGENLKKAKPLFTKNIYNELWKYHKLRNQVVHEGLEISSAEIESAYKTFHKVIYKLLG
ncbi:hypothetical protein H6764_01035 [Candidatus Nomurabacteria bacterium]|nr:hypothetical protein [Candidatus Nomurabacteria bacterium]